MKNIKFYIKLLSILIMIFTLLVFESCSYENPKTASLERNTNQSFVELLLSFCDSAVEKAREYDENIEYDISCENGWDISSELNYDLSKVERAITYTLRIKTSRYGEIEKNILKFFAVLDENENTITLVGGYINKDGYTEKLSQDEINEFVFELRNH